MWHHSCCKEGVACGNSIRKAAKWQRTRRYLGFTRIGRPFRMRSLSCIKRATDRRTSLSSQAKTKDRRTSLTKREARRTVEQH